MDGVAGTSRSGDEAARWIGPIASISHNVLLIYRGNLTSGRAGAASPPSIISQKQSLDSAAPLVTLGQNELIDGENEGSVQMCDPR